MKQTGKKLKKSSELKIRKVYKSDFEFPFRLISLEKYIPMPEAKIKPGIIL